MSRKIVVSSCRICGKPIRRGYEYIARFGLHGNDYVHLRCAKRKKIRIIDSARNF